MSTPHCATFSEWHQVEQVASIGSADCSCLLELRSRVEALEAAQRPHQDKLDRLIELDRDDDQPALTPQPTPAGDARRLTLLERLEAEGYNRTHGRAAILAVADWLRSEYPRREGFGTAWANLIEQEVDRA